MVKRPITPRNIPAGTCNALQTYLSYQLPRLISQWQAVFLDRIFQARIGAFGTQRRQISSFRVCVSCFLFDNIKTSNDFVQLCSSPVFESLQKNYLENENRSDVTSSAWNIFEKKLFNSIAYETLFIICKGITYIKNNDRFGIR